MTERNKTNSKVLLLMWQLTRLGSQGYLSLACPSWVLRETLVPRNSAQSNLSSFIRSHKINERPS